LGPEASRHTVVRALGQRVDAVTVHQAFFVGWAVATALHVLARLGPAVVLAGQRSAVPGGRRRVTAVAVTLILAAIAAALLLGTAGAWAHSGRKHTLRPAAQIEEAAAGRRPHADPSGDRLAVDPSAQRQGSVTSASRSLPAGARSASALTVSPRRAR
jgi:hypothetical protein